MKVYARRAAATLRATGVLPLVFVQFVALSALAAVLGTWQDEEYTLATTAHGVVYAFWRAIAYELQAPLYFCVLALLRTFDTSVLFARMVSVVAACGVTFVAAAIARRVWPRHDPRAFALLVALNPFVVYAAVEIRLYALALLVSAGLWLAFDGGFLSDGRTNARRATIALGIVAVYLQYFLVFELVAFAAALVVARRRRALVAYLASMVPVALAFVPLAINLRSQIGGAFGVAASQPGAYGNILVHPLLDFALPLGFQAIAGPLRHALTYALVALAVAAIVIGKPRLDRRTLAVLTLAASVEACYLFVSIVLHYELIPPRHFVALFVPELVAFYALAARFRGAYALRCASALWLLALLAAGVSLAADYRALAKEGDFPRVGALLSREARAGDAIAVFPADAVAPLARYYRGAARIVAFPRRLPPERYDVDALLVHSQAEAARALARLPHDGRLWFFEVGECDRFDFFGCVELRAVLGRNYRSLERHAFFGSELVRLRPREAPREGP